MTHVQRRTFQTTIVALASAKLLTATTAFAAMQVASDLKRRGWMDVGLLADFPPYGTSGAGNQRDGYDADVARLLARDLGIKLNLVPVTAPNRIPLLLSGKVDVLVASLVATPEREKQVTFSRPYSAAILLVCGRRTAPIKSAADLRKYRVGVTLASAEDIAVTSSAPRGTAVRQFDDDAATMQALISGQVDAIGCSAKVAAQIAKSATADPFEEKFVLRRQDMAIAVRPKDDDLLGTVNDFVARNTANGELNKLYRKWLERDLPASSEHR